jgi:ABC-type nitrate/sulfonate/bicarbonate transport system substrate-binding protein
MQAQAEGFFAEQGLTVCYTQVAGSGPQFAALYAGTYNIISTTTGDPPDIVLPTGRAVGLVTPVYVRVGVACADNSINRYVNGELFNNATAPKVQIVAAAGQVRQIFVTVTVPETKFALTTPGLAMLASLACMHACG